MKQFLVIFTAVFFLLSCQNQTGSAWQTLTFIQEKPLLTHLNLGDTAHGHGDGTAFEAPIMDTNGVKVGEVMGWLVTVDIMDGDSLNPVYDTERIGTVVYNLGDENEIIAQGGTSYHKGEKEMKLGIEHKRAIVGGTGRYKGLKGEVIITRNDDGTYTHVLDFKMQD
jgi:hypothetical protein